MTDFSEVPSSLRPKLSTAQKVKFLKGYNAVETIGDYMSFLRQIGPSDASQDFRFQNSGWPEREGFFGKIDEVPIQEGYLESVVLPTSKSRDPKEVDWKHEMLLGQQNLATIEYDLSHIEQMLIDKYGLEIVFAQISNQKPGGVHGYHFDCLDTYYYKAWSVAHPENPNKKFDRKLLWAEGDSFPIKIMIPLADWRYGQMFRFGMQYWDNWRAGDVVIFDWQNLPHCTANASFHHRPMVRVSGMANYSDPRHKIFQI